MLRGMMGSGAPRGRGLRSFASSAMRLDKKRIGVVGARGHTGRELMALVVGHPSMELAAVSSRELVGHRVSNLGVSGTGDLRFGNYSPEDCGRMCAGGEIDAWVLALPNGFAKPYSDAIAKASDRGVVCDLSADFRFDPEWKYGLPERHRESLKGARFIANPGCYATAAQAAILPFLDVLAPGSSPAVFGLSGYSGAGTTPSDKNNPDLLKDNVMPYSLTGHMHEREVSSQLGVQIDFMPHVAAYFRGIQVTVNLKLASAMTQEEALERARTFYDSEPLIHVSAEAPQVRYNVGKHHVAVGGFALSKDGKRLVVCSTIDNLLKGAASQAVQNLNLALGLDETAGLSPQGMPPPFGPPAAAPPPSIPPQEGAGREAAAMDRAAVLQTYKRTPITIVEGHGPYLYADNGRRYLDFVAGIAVNSIGHSDPEWIDAVSNQAKKLTHVSNLYGTIPGPRLASSLAKASFADRVFFCNSGTEANEAAMKFARKHGKTVSDSKTKIISFSSGFHGRTMGALSITAKKAYRAPFEPLVGGLPCYLPDGRLPDYNSIDDARAAIDDDTCAVFVEPVQGEGGCVAGNDDFLKELRTLCDKHNALLVFDEVQCGLARTGKLFAYQGTSVVPDLLTLAKPLAGGLPIGAVLCKDAAVATMTYGDHGSTFGMNPLVTASAQVVLDKLSHPEFLENVNRTSDYMRTLLKDVDGVKSLRGRGLLLGVVVDGKAAAVVEEAAARGLLLATAGEDIVRMVPPLIINETHVDEMISMFAPALKAARER